MKILLRTLAIIACVTLAVQTVRHAYLLWLEPRHSVLDRFDHPLKDSIAATTSLDALVRQYEPVRQAADKAKADLRARDPNAQIKYDEEPFRSAAALRDAISSWEARSRELRELRIYTLIGFIFAVAGLICFFKANRWLGVTLLITGFSEAVYWTSPTFLGTATQEFDRLLMNKLILSVAALALLAIGIRVLGVFREEPG